MSDIRMKYFMGFIIVACMAISCKKSDSISSGVLFYNATWSLPSFTVSWNNGTGIPAIAPGLSTGTADSPYVQAPAGTNLVTVRAGTTTLLDKNIYTTPATGNSFFLYDTSATAASPGTVQPVGILQLNDDLTLPDTAQIKYRVLYLAPDANVKADIWLVNGTTDSIRLDSAAVFSRDAGASSYAPFSAIKYKGQKFTLKFKKTATEQVYASVVNYPFSVRGIYTFVFSGLVNGTTTTGLKLSILHHRTP